MGSQQMYSLSWGEFGTSLSSTVQILRGDNEMVDVTLAAGGRIFPAHKLVLSAASPLLMELLKSTQCPHPVVMLAGVTAPDLEALLQFVYQGEVSVDPSQLPSLLQAAYCLDIQALAPQPAASSEKTMVHVSVPVVTGNEFRDIDSLPPMNDQVYTTLSPLQPERETNDQVQPTARKRKRKRVDRAKWPATEGIVSNEQVSFLSTTQPAIDPGTNQAIAAELNDTALKTESMEEQHCNVESISTKKLVSDLPVECSICGVTIRQSRNLRRHMELIHLKLPNAKRRNLGKEDKEEENVQQNVSVQTIQVVSNREELVDEGVVEILAGPSRLTQPPHMLTSPPLYHPTDTLVYSQSQAVQFSGHENLFRQQQTELLRGAGLYADAREHCAAE